VKVAVAVLVVLAIGVVDAVTGPAWAMQVFYLIPVAYVTTVAGRRAGLALAILSAATGFVADVIIPKSNDRLVAGLNAFFMLVTLVVVVELLERLRLRAAAANEAEQRSRDFLGFAAHQLRTPVAAMGTTVEALTLCVEADPAREELLIRLGAEAARVARIVHGLLRVARLDQAEELTFRLTDLHTLVGCEVQRAARTRPALTWSTQFDMCGSTIVECDPDALSEALANLLDNGVRHARNAVAVEVRASSELVELDVSDDGPGLSPEGAERAFQRFVSLDGRGGSGLGLPIARGIAEAHDGTLTYEDGGFRLLVPRHMCSTTDPQSTARRKHPERHSRAMRRFGRREQRRGAANDPEERAMTTRGVHGPLP
jgi:signal transduction histidine kinase